MTGMVKVAAEGKKANKRNATEQYEAQLVQRVVLEDDWRVGAEWGSGCFARRSRGCGCAR